MKPPPFRYARPASLEEAVRLLGSDDDAKVLAGGQSLIPMMNLRLARPELLVDLTMLDELRRLELDGDVLRIGACVRQRVAELSPLVRAACPLLGQALRCVAHHQVRARGTIGGSLAHADASSELCAVALALDAELGVVGSAGRRTIPASEFFLGPYMTTLAEDEILAEVRLPVIHGGRTAFSEITRRSGDFALAGVAAVVRVDTTGVVEEARLAALGVGPTAMRLVGAEDALVGARMSEEVVAAAAEAARAAADPVSDLHADAQTRRAALGASVERALRDVCELPTPQRQEGTET